MALFLHPPSSLASSSVSICSVLLLAVEPMDVGSHHSSAHRLLAVREEDLDALVGGFLGSDHRASVVDLRFVGVAVAPGTVHPASTPLLLVSPVAAVVAMTVELLLFSPFFLSQVLELHAVLLCVARF